MDKGSKTPNATDQKCSWRWLAKVLYTVRCGCAEPFYTMCVLGAPSRKLSVHRPFDTLIMMMSSRQDRPTDILMIDSGHERLLASRPLQRYLTLN